MEEKDNKEEREGERKEGDSLAWFGDTRRWIHSYILTKWTFNLAVLPLRVFFKIFFITPEGSAETHNKMLKQGKTGGEFIRYKGRTFVRYTFRWRLYGAIGALESAA